jgi:hypothetical protein
VRAAPDVYREAVRLAYSLSPFARPVEDEPIESGVAE